MTTKQYLKFSQCSVFGIIASSTARISHIEHDLNSNLIAVPACENVNVWKLRIKQKSLTLQGESSYVACLLCAPNSKNIAVGYADGYIRIFDLRDGSCVVSFCGHKSGVACLAYDDIGFNLASGGKDSEIVLWDVLQEAGMYRLKGHKGPVTKCHFFKERNILISSSKDTYIKFWDLDTQHCFQTLVGNRYEVLDFIVIKDNRLITGINGPDLKVWDLFMVKSDSESNEQKKKIKLDNQILEDFKINEGMELDLMVPKDLASTNSAEDGGTIDKFQYSEVGKLLTQGDKTTCLIVDKSERILGCHASTKVLQLYKILKPEEITKKFKKRKRKEINRRMKDATILSEIKLSLSDEFEALRPIQTPGKLDSFSIVVSKKDIAQITVALKNNSIYQYELDLSGKNNVAELCHRIFFPGHRSVVKSLSFSSDSLAILSTSEESVKIWRKVRESQDCTRTLECDSALCSVFLPGEKHCIVGTKNGTLDIYHISTLDLLETKQSHEGPINCLCLSPDEFGVTTGGKDKSVNFWEIEIFYDEEYSEVREKVSLCLKRTLQMPEEILCVRYSPDKKRIAIALLDNTVQVLFVDSLKLVFSLYGHVLPVTCMDISYDSSLIATGSEDKDIRIWSMEFGSCNKFIKKAHDKGITCLQFLPRTHMFFTGSRDNTIKQWDADNFQKITTLKGHQNEVNAMAISPDGISVVTASKDKSIRIWEKTQEPLILEEEQEKEREEEHEVGDLPVVPGEDNKEVALAGIKSNETIKSVDQLIEAIDVYKQEVLKLEEYESECKKVGKELVKPSPHPLLLAYDATCPVQYIRKAFLKIKSSELEGTLIYLPFNYVLEFLKIICEFVDRGWLTEFCTRCTSFIIRIHMGQIISSQNFHPVIEKLQDKLLPQMCRLRDQIGSIKTVFQLLKREIDEKEEVSMYEDVLDGVKQKKRRSKRKTQRNIVAFT